MNLARIVRSPLPGRKRVEEEGREGIVGGGRLMGDRAFVNRTRPLVGLIATGDIPLDEKTAQLVGKVLESEKRRLDRDSRK